MDIKSSSKKLSHALRHLPSAYSLTLDNGGWTPIKDVLKSFKISLDDLNRIVQENNKKRFEFNASNTHIRACQGHSISGIDLGLVSQIPPNDLYHGTDQSVIDLIMKDGLLKMNRNHVHLSSDLDTAKIVAKRRANPIILVIDALRMHQQGFSFFISTNGVWLTDFVPAEFISKL